MEHLVSDMPPFSLQCLLTNNNADTQQEARTSFSRALNIKWNYARYGSVNQCYWSILIIPHCTFMSFIYLRIMTAIKATVNTWSQQIAVEPDLRIIHHKQRHESFSLYMGDVYRIPHSLLFRHYENNNTGWSCSYFSGFTSDLFSGPRSYCICVCMYVNLCDIYF